MMMPTETWKPIAGYEGLYEVSDLGRVRSFIVSTVNGNRPGPHLRRLSTRKRDGYQYVTLITKTGRPRTEKVHQLVASAFLPPRPSDKHEPDHENGNRADNRAANLRWLTRKRNCWNQHSARSASGVRGVYASDKKSKPWRACVMRNGRYITVGHYPTIEEATVAREAAVARLEAAA